MLGPQFKDTFYGDTSYIAGDAGNVSEVTGPVMAGRDLQGMLYHPAAGTGTKADPLVTPEQRTAAIETGYKLDKESHAAVHENLTGKKAGARKLESDRMLAVDSIYESGIPVSEMDRKTSPKVAVSSTAPVRHKGSSSRGNYSPEVDRAWTKVESKKVWKTTESEVPTAGSGDLIVNPKPLQGGDYDEGGHRFSGYFSEGGTFDPIRDKPRTPNSTDYALHESNMKAYAEKKKRYDDLVASGRFPVIEPSEPIHPDKRYESQMRDYEYEMEDRIEGVEAHHLFSKPTPPTNSKVFSTEVGEGYKYLERGTDMNTRYYTRQPASEWETQMVSTAETTHSAPEDVMVHEIGHGKHLQGHVDPTSNRAYNRAADPFEESQADAYADMYSRHANRTSEALDPTTPSRNASLSWHGYGSKSDRWSNDTERALYRVARQASGEAGKPLSKSYKTDAIKEATGGEGYRTKDESHLEWINRSNTMALGRLMSEHPHLVDAFTFHEEEKVYSPEDHITRMAGAADKAKEAYESARERRLYGGTHTQGELKF